MNAESAVNGEEARFEFGENWRRFLATLDETRIELARRSLADMLGLDSYAGKRFLDSLS